MVAKPAYLVSPHFRQVAALEEKVRKGWLLGQCSCQDSSREGNSEAGGGQGELEEEQSAL